MNTRLTLHVIFACLSVLVLILSACAPATAPAPVVVAEKPVSAMPAATRGPAIVQYDASSPYAAAPAPTQGAPYQRPSYEPVTAGVVDDNQQWQEYLSYRDRQRYLRVNDRDIRERYIVRVVDAHQQPVHDAVVRIWAGQQFYFEGRTDSGGQMLFHPRALDPQRQWQQIDRFTVTAYKGQAMQTAIFTRQNQERWTLVLPGAPIAQWAQLDLVFLMDATGSMQDEIDKLKTTMGEIAGTIDALPERPDVRYALVAYRDRGDQFVVRTNDFTSDVSAFQRTLAALQASGGGDDPNPSTRRCTGR
jgi:hypothetical protein